MFLRYFAVCFLDGCMERERRRDGERTIREKGKEKPVEKRVRSFRDDKDLPKRNRLIKGNKTKFLFSVRRL